MAADITDKIRKSFNAENPTVTFVTSTRSMGGTTLACDNLTGWPTDTAVDFITYQLNTDGETPVPGTQIDWKGIVSGSNITNLTRVAGASDSGSAVNDIVEAMPTGSWGNDIATAILVHADQDGTLKAGAVDNAAVLASNVVTTAKILDANVTTAKLADEAVTMVKIDYDTIPWGIATYNTYGSGGGQVISVASTTTLAFNTLETNSHTGVTMPSNGELQVATAGIYSVLLNTSVSDGPQNGNFQKIEYTTDGGTNWYSLRNFNNSTNIAGADTGLPSAEGRRYLPANARVRARYIVTGGNTRLAAANADRKEECSLSIVRIA